MRLQGRPDARIVDGLQWLLLLAAGWLDLCRACPDLWRRALHLHRSRQVAERERQKARTRPTRSSAPASPGRGPSARAGDRSDGSLRAHGDRARRDRRRAGRRSRRDGRIGRRVAASGSMRSAFSPRSGASRTRWRTSSAHSDRPLRTWTRETGCSGRWVAVCCISETMNTSLMTRCLEVAKDEEIRSTLRELLEDEVRHARLSWSSPRGRAQRRATRAIRFATYCRSCSKRASSRAFSKGPRPCRGPTRCTTTANCPGPSFVQNLSRTR